MVKYITHLTVRHEVYPELVEWLKSEHIPELLQVPGFVNAELCLRKGGNMESSSKEVKVIYSIKDEEDIKNYISNWAMKLREKGLEKFPGQFSANREVWLESHMFQG